MTLRALFAALAIVVAPLASAQPAGLFRAYLALDGVDTNPCTLPLPCRLLPAALAVVQDGGEVWMLDSANYNTGPVAINKSVTILAVPGVLGSVVATDVTGNAINIAGAGAKVTLRNLNIRYLDGLPLNRRGVHFTAGDSLTMQDCHVFGFSLGEGVLVRATNAVVAIAGSTFSGNETGYLAVNASRTTIAGSRFFRNTMAGAIVQSDLDGTTTTLAVTRSDFTGAFFGVVASGVVPGTLTRASVADSTFFLQSNTGLLASSGNAGASVEFTAHGNFVAGAVLGARAEGSSAKLVVSENAFARGVYGVRQETGAVLETAQNNVMRLNGTGSNQNTFGTVTNVSPF